MTAKLPKKQFEFHPSSKKTSNITQIIAFAFCLLTTPAYALLITANPGADYQSAQALDGRFDLTFSEDIGDYRVDADTGRPYSENTSTSIPHVTVDASHALEGREHWYSFSVAKTSSIILDVDYGAENGPWDYYFPGNGYECCYPDMDFFLWLDDSNGNTLASNDDHDWGTWGPVAGAAGSVHHYDPFIQTVVDPGRYYVGVGRQSRYGVMEFEPDYGYMLQVSVSHPVPEPSTTALLLIALGGFAAKRLKKSRV